MRSIQSIEDALQGISLLDAIKLLASNVSQSNRNSNQTESKQEPEKDKFLTGKEVDTILQISAPTRHRYANDGILTRHKVSAKKILYKQEEVLKLLQAKDAQAGY